jgi:very-short-patch-repair endonuclease
MARQGWRVVRVWNDDVYKRLNDTLDHIEAELTASIRKSAREPGR